LSVSDVESEPDVDIKEDKSGSRIAEEEIENSEIIPNISDSIQSKSGSDEKPNKIEKKKDNDPIDEKTKGKDPEEKSKEENRSTIDHPKVDVQSPSTSKKDVFKKTEHMEESPKEKIAPEIDHSEVNAQSSNSSKEDDFQSALEAIEVPKQQNFQERKEVRTNSVLKTTREIPTESIKSKISTVQKPSSARTNKKSYQSKKAAKLPSHTDGIFYPGDEVGIDNREIPGEVFHVLGPI